MPVGLHLVPLSVVTAFAFVSFAISSFGENILFQIGWRLLALVGLSSSDSIVPAVTILTIIKLPIDAIQFVHLRRDTNWRLALTMGIPAMTCTLIGVEVLLRTEGSPWPRRVLGVIMLLVLSWRSYFELEAAKKECLEKKLGTDIISNTAVGCQSGDTCCEAVKQDEGELESANVIISAGEGEAGSSGDTGASPVAAKTGAAQPRLGDTMAPERYQVGASLSSFLLPAAVGATAGFLGGLFSVAGPPLMVFIHITNIGKNEWRATGCALACLEIPVRFVYLLFIKKRFDEDFVPEYITALVSGLIGVLIGNLLVHRVSQRGFMRLILLLLLFGGVMLLL